MTLHADHRTRRSFLIQLMVLLWAGMLTAPLSSLTVNSSPIADGPPNQFPNPYRGPASLDPADRSTGTRAGQDPGAPLQRQRYYLSSNWSFRTDGTNEGRSKEWYRPAYDDDGWRTVAVPSCWNTYDESLDHYEGVGWYRTTFGLPDDWQGKRITLRFLGANYNADVWLNGEHLGGHDGGYSGFGFTLGSRAKFAAQNVLAVRVDNTRRSYTIPAQWYMWWNWGGLYREVFLEATESLFVSDLKIRTELDMETNRSVQSLIVSVNNAGGAPETISLNISVTDDEKVWYAGKYRNLATVAEGSGSTGRLNFTLLGPRLWSPETPALYTLTVDVLDSSQQVKDTQSLRFGVREIELVGNRLLLNGHPIILKGAARHEEYPGVGRAVNETLTRKDLELMKAANMNFIRLGHYPNHPLTLDLADEYGFIVYEEIPAFQLAPEQLVDSTMLKKAKYQLTELIERDCNHPSIVFWGLANEISSHTSEGRAFIKELYDHAKALDPTRLISFASNHHLEDRCFDIVDVISINEYYGWYLYDTPYLKEVLEKIHSKYPNKPILITEFGAGAVRGRHGTLKFTEEYQARFLYEHWKILRAKDYVLGGAVWSWADFRDPSRAFNPVAFVNLKGLVDYDRNPKLAYYIVADMYGDRHVVIPDAEEPVVVGSIEIMGLVLIAFIWVVLFTGWYLGTRDMEGFPVTFLRVLRHPLEFAQNYRPGQAMFIGFIGVLLLTTASRAFGIRAFMDAEMQFFPLAILGPLELGAFARELALNPTSTFLAIILLPLAVSGVHFLVCKLFNRKTRYGTSLSIVSWSTLPFVFFLPLIFMKAFWLFIVVMIVMWVWSMVLLTTTTKRVVELTRRKALVVMAACLGVTLALILGFLAWMFYPALVLA